MSSSYYEGFAQAIIEQAAHDKRTQPWKCSTKPGPANSNAKDEWYKVAGEEANKHCGGRVDVREQAFPMGEVDVRMNAFPMVELSVRTNVFPI